MKYILPLALLFTVFSAQGQRIITAGSAITETVCALGDCSKIVASDRTSLYPAEIQKLPSIGYRTSISAEGIISLRPTLFIVELDYVKSEVIEHIKSAGISVLAIERTFSFEGTKDLVQKIAAVLNRQEEGKKLVAKIEGELADAKKIVGQSGTTPRVLCVFNRDKSALNLAGANTFSEILKYAGAVPAVTGVEGYKPLSTETLLTSRADFLLMFESGVQALGGIEGVLAIPGVQQLPAGKKKQVIAMDGIRLSNFGPRLGEAVKELATQLHSHQQ
ncbi:MAG: ABC transporter substrate-binding protein [Cyclobacteriaceae bacterium]|nr:ABC transporter substrate-binding protein [Cyclobacteriaceae bacterium]